ncbi:glycosyltransferase [Kocuria sp. CPCC 205292]|uniref:glycosyltransferase n=1 Tax=Kocuria cellulosilytica TaxID=3071451 RepID=UPI0034D47813
MPSYNSQTYINEAINSAVKEMSDFDELLVQDGQSTDETLSLLAAYEAQYDQVQVESGPDKGQSDALNKALMRATGDYVVWLNSDDVLLPGSLAALRAHIEKSDNMPSLVFGGHQVLRADGSVIGSYMPPRLERHKLMLRGCYVFSGSVAISRSLLLESGGFANQFDYCMDLDLFFRLLDKSADSPLNVPEYIGALRWHDESKSGDAGYRFVGDGWKVRGMYARSSFDHVARIGAALVQSFALFATPVRHSVLYSKLRGKVRK